MDKAKLEKLKADLKAEILKELDGRDYKAANAKTGAFSKVREEYKSKLYDTYGTVWYWQVWENIRKLSLHMAGVRYVRDLTPSLEENAASYARILCEMAVKKED